MTSRFGACAAGWAEMRMAEGRWGLATGLDGAGSEWNRTAGLHVLGFRRLLDVQAETVGQLLE